VQIELQHIGKRYVRDWIFKDLSCILASGSNTTLIGSNGSGKSTLLKIISGYLTPTEGLIVWRQNHIPLNVNDIHMHIAMCAPYQSPFLEFTLRENFTFYASFKNMHQNMQPQEFAAAIELSSAIDKPLQAFSSGMLQRVKLGLALLSDVPVILLDEPTSHLDKKAQTWYSDLLMQTSQVKTVIIATNEPEKDAPIISNAINIRDFQTQ
jgi:ABC-type multidrug transport system ATPase subunit